MNSITKLTPERIEKLALEIRAFLLEHDMWIDTDIYFNGKKFATYDPADGQFYYNDKEHLVVVENADPRNSFEYVNPDHILSMSFEGPVYEMVNGYGLYGLLNAFDEIFEKYGVYYELGNAWNLSCYYI